jgi:hypothetical protein
VAAALGRKPFESKQFVHDLSVMRRICWFFRRPADLALPTVACITFSHKHPIQAHAGGSSIILCNGPRILQIAVKSLSGSFACELGQCLEKVTLLVRKHSDSQDCAGMWNSAHPKQYAI